MRVLLCIHLACSLVLIPAVSFSMDMDDRLDALGDRLSMASDDGQVRARVSGLLEMDAYVFNGEPPSLIRTHNEYLIQPRAVFFLDVQAGPTVYGFAQARVDRGFDPSEEKTEFRLDEYALRYTPWNDGRLSLQAGQFATVVGRWVTRHLSWQNPFVSAPLIYENPTRLSDLHPPTSGYSLNKPFDEAGYYYNPIIWGPSYASGLAASGRHAAFEWAVELKNTALSSRPEFWPISKVNMDAPTVSGRVAWRPDLRWNIGLSGSQGAYAGLDESFSSRRDYEQRVFLIDISYEYRHLQIWAEIARSEFRLPEVDHYLTTHAGFVEARYKLAPRFFVAARWNHQVFSDLQAYGRDLGRWGDAVRRLDLSATWRFNAHSQLQLEVNQYWSEPPSGNRLVLLSRLTVRF